MYSKPKMIITALTLLAGGALFAQSTVTCSSDDMRKHYCQVDTRGGVRLLHQRSDAACNEGSTWGFDRRGIWVDRGCRADFEVGGRGPDRNRQRGRQGRGGEVSTVTCSSDDMRRHYCQVDTSGGVRLLQQRSEAACSEGSTWGFDDRGIWVDRGCRADFEVGGRGRDRRN